MYIYRLCAKNYVYTYICIYLYICVSVCLSLSLPPSLMFIITILAMVMMLMRIPEFKCQETQSRGSIHSRPWNTCEYYFLRPAMEKQCRIQNPVPLIQALFLDLIKPLQNPDTDSDKELQGCIFSEYRQQALSLKLHALGRSSWGGGCSLRWAATCCSLVDPESPRPLN